MTRALKATLAIARARCPNAGEICAALMVVGEPGFSEAVRIECYGYAEKLGHDLWRPELADAETAMRDCVWRKFLEDRELGLSWATRRTRNEEDSLV